MFCKLQELGIKIALFTLRERIIIILILIIIIFFLQLSVTDNVCTKNTVSGI